MLRNENVLNLYQNNVLINGKTIIWNENPSG